MSLVARHRLTPACLAIAVATLGTPAFADTNAPLATDRPSFIPSASVVGENYLQVETSVQRVQDNEDPNAVAVWTTPTLMRFGLPGPWEFRASSDAFARVRTENDVTNGFSDLELGMKGELPQTLSPNLSVAWLLQAALPTGSDEIGSEGVRPSFMLTSHWQLPKNTSLGFMPGLRMDQDDTGDKFPTGMVAMNVAHDWNPKISSYAQVAGRELRSVSRGGKVVTWDLGGAWKIVRDTQVDASIGFGLKENDPDFGWTVGISQRFTPEMLGPLSGRSD